MIALEIDDFRRFSMGQKESFEIEQIRKSWKEKKQDSWISRASIDEGDLRVSAVKGVSTSPDGVMDFDELLPHVGEYGIYQVFLFILMLPFLFFLAFMYMSQMFMTLVPNDHYCHINGISNRSLSDAQM